MSAIRSYFKKITPPYKNHDLPTLFASLFILFAIPVTVYLTLNAREPSSKAEGPVIRGSSGDLWADVVLGKRDFTEISEGMVLPNKVRRPGGVVVDRNNNRVYIFDGHNSRILGLNLTNCLASTTTCSAASSAGGIVIGQPFDTDHGACNLDGSFQTFPVRAPATANTVCGVNEGTRSIAEILPFVQMAVDSSGRLIFPDPENHRVLIYDNPFVNNASANQQIGQTNMSGNLCNRGISTATSSSICFANYGDRQGTGVMIEPGSGDLWVADSGNNRVLRFPKDTSNPGHYLPTANLVIGQNDFTQTVPDSSEDRFFVPNSLAFGSSGELYVADAGNSRVQVFNKPFSNGMSASRTFGSLLGTIGAVDPSGVGFWQNNYTQQKLTLWSWSGSLLRTLSSSEHFGGGIGIDTQNNIFVAGYEGATNVALYKNATSNKTTPDRWIFLAPHQGKENSRMGGGAGIAIASNQLFVSDTNRVLFWNNPTTVTNGKPADGCLIQVSCTAWDGNLSGFVGQIKSDASNRIWVRSSKDVKVYQAPVTSGAAPIKTIAYPLNVLGGGQISLLNDRDGTGLLPTSDGKFLWLAESNRHRVLRIRDPLTNPVVDLVLGQTDFTSTLCNRGLVAEAATGTGFPNTLCHPGDLSFDRLGNMYVADSALESSGNRRLLMFAAGKFPTNNTSVIFAPSNSAYDATKIFPQGPNSKYAPWEPAFDNSNRMVLGLNTYWSEYSLAYYNNPTDPTKVIPDGYIKDFNAEGLGAVFDQNNDLYIATHTRGRVLKYKTPFVEPTGNLAPVVNITSHQNNTWYKGGTHKITASVTDDYNSAVKAEFFVDNVLLFTDYVEPYEADWLVGINDGSHNITVKAYDHLNKMSQQSITVNTDHQGPGKDVIWNTPANGSTVSGRIPVSINADDYVSGTKKVEFLVDGNLVATDTIADSYGFWWNSTSVPNGTHTLTAKAYDQPDNITTLNVTVTVNNTSSVTNPTSLYLNPTSVGTYAEYSEQRIYPFTSTDEFESFDEEVPDDMWSYLFTNRSDFVNMRSSAKIDHTRIPSNATISSVEVWTRAKIQVGVPKIKLLLRTGGTDYYSSEVSLNNTSFKEYSHTWSTNPANNAAWTPASLANAEVGVSAIPIGGAAHHITAVWMVVNYTVGQAKPGDLTGDGKVNTADLAILVSTWNSTTDLRADFNSDGRINTADLAKLVSYWGS